MHYRHHILMIAFMRVTYARKNRANARSVQGWDLFEGRCVNDHVRSMLDQCHQSETTVNSADSMFSSREDVPTCAVKAPLTSCQPPRRLPPPGGTSDPRI